MDTNSLIIVNSGGYESEYARKLLALLSHKEIAAVLWTEKEYISNRPQLPTKQHLIFFGLGPETKKQAMIIKDWVFDEYACKIGYLGKYCVITAWDGDLSWDSLGDFSSYCQDKARVHPDVVIPSSDSIGEILNVVNGVFTDRNNNSVWRAQYSILIYEFLDNWVDSFIKV